MKNGNGTGTKKKKLTGGQPGNMNGNKSVLPALRRVMGGRALPSELKRVVLLAQGEADELIEDRGGADQVTAAERVLVGNWQSARLCELLIMDELFKRGSGIIDGEGKQWDLSLGMQRLAGFLSVQSRILKVLGISRKARPVRQLETYLEQNYGTKKN